MKKSLLYKLFSLSSFSLKTVNYNEVIEELLSQHQDKIIRKDKYLKIRDLAGNFDKKLFDEYRQEKLKDLNREEQKYPISNSR